MNYKNSIVDLLPNVFFFELTAQNKGKNNLIDFLEGCSRLIDSHTKEYYNFLNSQQDEVLDLIKSKVTKILHVNFDGLTAKQSLLVINYLFKFHQSDFSFTNLQKFTAIYFEKGEVLIDAKIDSLRLGQLAQGRLWSSEFCVMIKHAKQIECIDSYKKNLRIFFNISPENIIFLEI